MALDVGFVAQTPSLPGAGASAGGLGETFSPDLSTGTGSFSIPITLPNGPNDIGPALTLRYDTSAPNGPFGMGWSLPLPRLLRSTVRGRPHYDERDELVLEGSGPLVRTPDGGWRPEVDNGDWRVQAVGDGFVVTDRAGVRYELGTGPESRISGPGGTWSWLLAAIEDNLGHRCVFHHRAAGAQRYLAEITYGAYRVVLRYGPRPDVLRSARGGFLLLTEERCTAIELHLPAEQPSLVREWRLGHAPAEPSGASQLVSVTMTGTARDGSRLTAPPLTLTYTRPGPPRLDAVPARAEGPPGLDGGGRVELVDWSGDGLPDVLAIGPGGSARIWPNTGGGWDRPRFVADLPQLAGDTASAGLVDLDGDGLADAVRLDAPATGYQPRDRAGFTRPVQWTRSPSVPIGGPSTRIADLDGDGIPDLLWSTGRTLLLAHRDDTGWEPRPLVVPARPGGPPTDLTDPHVFCADMTGDGSPDLVRVDGRGVVYWPYLGSGVFGDAVRMGTAPVLPSDVDSRRVFLVDVDGDGCADVVVLDDAAGAVRWWPNCAGDHFAAERTVRRVATGAIRELRVADLRGTGSPALCWTAPRPSGRVQWYALDLLGGARCGLLAEIDNGVGRRTRISYSTSAAERARDRVEGRHWPATLPLVLPVVAATTTTDLVTGREDVTRFRYHDGRFDGLRREFCGFGQVEQIDVGDERVPTLLTTRWFHTGLDAAGAEPATGEQRARLRAVRGRLLRQDRADAAGALFDRTDYAWEVADGDAGTVVPRLRRTTAGRFEGATAVSRIETEVVAWDADGNAREQVERAFEGGDAAPAGTLRTRTDYALDPTGRYRQRVARVRQDDGAGSTVADTVTAYDGLPPGQLGAAGLVTARWALAMTDELVTAVHGADVPDLAAHRYLRRPEAPGWWIELGSYARTVDPDGTVRGTLTGLGGATSTMVMDPTGCYPAAVTDAVGNTVTAAFDPRVYRATSVTEPSGAVSRASYDALARLTATVLPGDTDAAPTVARSYATGALPVTVTAEHLGAVGGPPLVAREFLDGDGRLLERRGRDETGEVVDVRLGYGPRGVRIRQFLPHRPASDAYGPDDPDVPSAELFCDALGRPVRSVRPDGAVQSVRYAGSVVEETDAAGRVTRRVLDAAGRVVRSEEPRAGGTLVATFAFDLRGSLVEHVDPGGHRTRFTHDLLGRLLRTDRPEATHVAVLDPAGNAVESRSGSTAVTRRYDAANRLAEVRHAGVADPVLTCVYHDDGGPAPADAGGNTAGGRLVRVDDEAGSTVLDYDARGRIATKTMTAGGQTLRMELALRPDGLPDTVTYPGGVVARHSYDRRGRLVAIDGVLDEINYDLAGRRLVTRYANGVVHRAEHDPRTGWLRAQRIDGPGGTLREIGLDHDVLGNLAAVTSPDPDLAWTYQHDDRSQLVAAAGSAGALAYSYDAAGNLLSATGRGTYAYGGGGAAATCLTAVGTDTFGYDDRGHVRSAPWGTHTVDPEGRLRVIELAAGGRQEFAYGHTGAMVLRREVDAAGALTREVRSPDRLLRIEDGELVLQISDGDRIVARHHAGSGERSWLHVDHLGSLVLVTDAAGAVVLSQRFDPYGRVLARDGTAVVSQGFGTGEAAGPDLVLLGARWYCPLIGRFLSPDPVVGDAHDALAWSAYAYCRNNPVSCLDPSGRSFWKVFGAVLAIVAIAVLVVVVSVLTFGAAAPLGVGVFIAVMAGIVAGGVIGGIAAARAGGDAGDIVLGALVGAAVGGWAAFGAAVAGPAVAGALGAKGAIGGAVAGGVSGAINGAAMGFAAGFAGGRNDGFGDVMEKVLVGAVVGAVVGAALGYLSGMPAPKESLADGARKMFSPEQAPGGPNGPITDPPLWQDPVHSLPDALGKTAGGLGGKAAGLAVPHVAAATARYTGAIALQTILVDVTASGPAALFYDDLQDYLRSEGIDLGWFNFLKEDL